MAYTAFDYSTGNRLTPYANQSSGLAIYGGNQANSLNGINLYEQSRALYASIAMSNVCALSVMANQLNQIAPASAQNLRAIINAYTIGACSNLLGW